MDIEAIAIEKDPETQVILGHAGFIKTAEDLYEAMANAAPYAKFGIAFAEASGKRLVRTEGNDDSLAKMAERNMLRIGAGHSFIIMFKGAFPITVLNGIKAVNEVSSVYFATANQVQVLLCKTDQGSAIIGIVDGNDAGAAESPEDIQERRNLLRKLGYKK